MQHGAVVGKPRHQCRGFHEDLRERGRQKVSDLLGQLSERRHLAEVLELHEVDEAGFDPTAGEDQALGFGDHHVGELAHVAQGPAEAHGATRSSRAQNEGLAAREMRRDRSGDRRVGVRRKHHEDQVDAANDRLDLGTHPGYRRRPSEGPDRRDFTPRADLRGSLGIGDPPTDVATQCSEVEDHRMAAAASTEYGDSPGIRNRVGRHDTRTLTPASIRRILSSISARESAERWNTASRSPSAVTPRRRSPTFFSSRKPCRSRDSTRSRS